MKRILLTLITWYQKYLSPDTGLPQKLGFVKTPVCVFYPTCSEYTKEAIVKYGALKGILLGLKRFSRCHPGVKDHFDPLP
jgi:uncharacterized protein